MLRPFRGVTRATLPRELLAGLTLLAISVPLNIGYAQIAGLPVTAGLYALVVPTLVYVILVSSRQVVASPDAAAAALVFSSLVGIGVSSEDLPRMAAAQAIVCGAVLLVASVLRWGFLANFLSHPILVGFVAGLAAEVLLSQVRKMLGIPRAQEEGFFRELLELIGTLGEVSVMSLLVSAASLVLLIAGRLWLPRVPMALVVLVAATVATMAFGLSDRGVAVLGAVPAGPPQFEIPMLSWAEWLSLIPSAAALAMITMAEGVLMSRTYAHKHGYEVDADRDLLAFGAANVAAGLSTSFAVGSSTSRTAAMDQAGSRSQLPSVVLAVGTVLLLLFGTELLAEIPAPAIGAVVAVAVVGLLGIHDFREIARYSRYEAGIALICLLGVLVLGALPGLLIAFVFSLINLARRASSPEVSTEVVGGVLIVRFAGPVFFANGGVLRDSVLDAAHSEEGLRAIVLDAEGVGDVDVTGRSSWERLLDELEPLGLPIAITRVRPGLRDRLESFELADRMQEFATNRAAVAAYGTRGSSSEVDDFGG